ncbi:MAG TPA: tetratricopeptide repeat protein [Aggregatilinea sp.]|uniref:tetratricopeptide repeat protein n=1 Tax=Aggregatilinea sp. TaxID=2806333 RepID=UPI002BBEFE1E|nr:tetratricopeptide repeat protein [Aggregatilinea sp.]HML21969.1 tetratricopeptide repeat protein [Aggregatilinea sp.]
MSRKQPPNPKFGKLLTEAVSSVAKRKHMNMEVVEEEIALAVSLSEDRNDPLSFYTVQRWMRGYPPDERRLMTILNFCARYGRIRHDLARSIVNEAGYHHLLHELRGQAEESDVPGASRFYSNLPRRHASFWGRVQQISELHQLLSPENRAAVLVVYGIGGVGKTSLVVEAIHQMLADRPPYEKPPYDAVIFTSARDGQLRLVDVLDEIGRVLEFPTVLRQSDDEKLAFVQNLLRQFRVLLIIDNFETIEDARLRRFALEGVPEFSKVIITTRDYHPGLWPATHALHLTGLDDDEALGLIRDWAREHNLSPVVAAADVEVQPLLEATEGNPWALLMSLGFIAHRKQPLDLVLQDLLQGHGAIFEHMFSTIWELLDEDERRILLALSCFASTGTRDAIGTTADVEGYKLTAGLGRLTELSMMSVEDVRAGSDARYHLHPLTRAFAQSMAERTGQLDTLRMRWLAWCVDFAEPFGGESFDVVTLHTLSAEQENLMAATRYALQIGAFDECIRLVTAIWHHLYVVGDWNRLIQLILDILNADGLPSPSEQPRLLTLKSFLEYFYYLKEPTSHEVLDQLRDIEQAIRALGDESLLLDSNILNYLTQAYLTAGEHEQARKYAEQHIALCQRFINLRGVISGQYNLARALHDLGELDKAQQILTSLIREAGLMQWERAVGHCNLCLAQVLRDQGREEQSHKHYEAALQIGERWGELLLQEMVLIDLAMLAWRNADNNAALEYAERARDLAIRLDLEFDKSKMDEMVAAINGVPSLDDQAMTWASDGQATMFAKMNAARGLI